MTSHALLTYSLLHNTLPQDLPDDVHIVPDSAYCPSTHVGVFGWVISDNQGTVLSTSHGTARGKPLNSFQAEAYGMLSTLCYFNTCHCQSATLWIDNKDLVQRTTSLPSISTTLCPHIDVVLCIQTHTSAKKLLSSTC